MYGSTSFVTTAPDATTAPLPILTPGNTKLLISYSFKQAIVHLFLFAFFYTIFRQYGDRIWQLFSWIVVGLIIAIAAAYYSSYSILGNMALLGQSWVLGVSYCLLYPLPLVLCLKNGFWKWFCVILSAIVILSGIKRGGLLGFSLTMLTYYFVQNFYIADNKHVFRTMVWIISVVAMLVGFFVVSDKVMNDGLIMERIYSISDDGGSGRDDMMINLFNNIPEFSYEELIFGHGFEGSVVFSPLSRTAHNDFLEVLYDYGLIGLAVYLWLYILMFKMIRRLIKQKSKFAAPLAAGFILLCFMSMLSHIIIYPYFTFYALYIGVFSGLTRNKKTKNVIYENRNNNISLRV